LYEDMNRNQTDYFFTSLFTSSFCTTASVEDDYQLNSFINFLNRAKTDFSYYYI